MPGLLFVKKHAGPRNISLQQNVGVLNRAAEVLLSKADLQELRAVQTGCVYQALPDLIGWNHSMRVVESDVHNVLVKQASLPNSPHALQSTHIRDSCPSLYCVLCTNATFQGRLFGRCLFSKVFQHCIWKCTIIHIAFCSSRSL